MRLSRVLAFLFALLPSAASATIWRVDFVVDDLQLQLFGAGSSFITLPADGIVRGAYFYDDTPFNGVMNPGQRELSWSDGETGAIVRIGPDLFTLFTSQDPSAFDFLAIHWLNDVYSFDDENPENSIYFDRYAAHAQEVRTDGRTVLDLQWQQRVLASSVDQGGPFPDLLAGASYTDLADPARAEPSVPEFQFSIEHGSSITLLSGDVTELVLSVSPVPEPEQTASLGASVAMVAALARRRRVGARDPRDTVR